ncbi:sigma-70 family RNA polymerase sigma factor [Pseudooceanicola sp. CBS1P-1]|uniref:Sigma-70 family RNA polymerase sigma factor n=1 Tax=Pseudooceanicola albus TaxID=2692189 RepID=A0A6L7FYT5_9RHOB|nr:MULTISPECIES: sigma-70 family RNA polymerase sigma factor [Pseudooceanicola]MBT9383391.1 sigma-70 family RNA polymerase sigma factor [Pseudooceanicola endophyticus]MXN16287.1 sigma-70 family RNA polymerase sigma factor [Pseudooceanicola albus]
MTLASQRDPAEIEALIARVALRDRAAFAALYDATSGKLFAVCLRVLRNRAEAEEALQEVFLRVWHKADLYAPTGHSPMTWLITVARNLAIDRLRARQSAGEVRDLDEMPELSDARPGPEAQVIARSEAVRITACMDELEADRARAVRGAYLQGLSYAQLAARHEVPLNTMRTWLRRSLLKLKECMSR